MATDSTLNYLDTSSLNSPPLVGAPLLEAGAPGVTQVTDDSGNVTYFDANGNAITTVNSTPNWDTSPTSSAPNAASAATPVSAGGGTDISNLGTFFGQLASGVAGLVKATSAATAPVCPSTLPCAAPNKPGYNYNPQTGQYTLASSGFSLSSLTAGNGLLILVAIVVGIFFFARKHA